jgi:hypothetical protein
MGKHLRHVRHQAQKHHEAHQRLKWLLAHEKPRNDKAWTAFFVTFVFVLLTLLLYRNWGKITDLFQAPPKIPAQTLGTQGVKTGVMAAFKVEEQSVAEAMKTAENTATQNTTVAQGENNGNPAQQTVNPPQQAIQVQGSVQAVNSNQALGQQPVEKPQAQGTTLKDTVWLTNILGSGQHLTHLDQSNAKSLLKSIVATYYLGEKTVDINSTLALDTQLLSQIKNALSVDLFEYLNQAVNRSDSLDGYVSLLKVLAGKCQQRITDLTYKIDFLNANFKSQETEIKTSESTFFDNLKIFNGPNAEDELGKFIGLQQTQTETRAKSGAYDSLRNYYEFFLPKLNNLIKAIAANRDPLIAGVKVVEVQNMTLPLIIQQ